MADLSIIEKRRFERFLGMSSGYVLDFSNRTFAAFVTDSVQRDIYSPKYDHMSGSKANLLRKFWEIEPNHIVGKLLYDLVDHATESGREPPDPRLVEECQQIVSRLRQGAPVEALAILDSELTEAGFEHLTSAVRTSLDANRPAEGLDRLHTFVTKYLRRICARHEIQTPREKPIHSLMGEYIRKLKSSGLIDSQMTERILKSNIATLEAFNDVRNSHSLAHDNPILNYDESLLIFNNVTSSIRFVQSVERRLAEKQEAEAGVATEQDDLPRASSQEE